MWLRTIIVSIFLFLIMPFQTYAGEPMKILISTDDGQHSINVTLDNNPTARDFYHQLPMDLILVDYGDKEKVSELPKKLTQENAPKGHKPLKGQLAYFAPWNNFVIYREDASFYPGIIYLGKIETGLLFVDEAGKIKVHIQSAP
ncbi:Uncharacterized conserved protein [Commensalibacter communis]|uniref:Uncharacterized conserved protein n=2 Tax=Commensalibacter communis TaxID=2972786 RepID=A0A9W4TMB1_9PROT|nr:Uncharacterized conserved protein [Commensalibacter communis]CAI3923901.1 Uncharacterized conserved protein [Commensalibacter communis]CAI3930784.1 Uncharacterized conserved protein [Commensalibacter communis]CAI3938504.1 Uncharacterized conserved protein [Commensalibacter communis]CAI3939070.1 Uncharacterized conserved protein [Commensalibacter communis]